MLDRFHLQGLDEAGLSAAQIMKVRDLVCHNMGNALTVAVAGLETAIDKTATDDELRQFQRDIRVRYRELIEGLRELADRSLDADVSSNPKSKIENPKSDRGE